MKTEKTLTIILLIITLVGCGHNVPLPDIPDRDSGITVIGTEWAYWKVGNHYIVYAEELEALTEVQSRLHCDDPMWTCITTDEGLDMYKIKIVRN